ncbi:MAG: lytic transglycosylase domain-containing protein [Anaerolineae bacterium]|nr:lytic transglycosylase domain-containing protein [Anaerolineae bacterium]
MHPAKWGGVVALVIAAILLSTQPVAAQAPIESPPGDFQLSPYWGPEIQRWESLIIEHATYRGLDPDLVAALIWKESRGDAGACGPAGAVGLMMIMPREAGFTWRPTIAELEDPWTNLFWGCRVLATVIRESGGDLYNALAAYNGGWEQIHYRGPNRFATDILSDYARAIAMRHDLSQEGHWVATVAAIDEHCRAVLTVVGPQRPLTRYTVRPVAAHIPDATTDGLPVATAFSPPDGWGRDTMVGIWLWLDGRIIGEPALPPSPASAPPIVRFEPGAIWSVLGDSARSIL